MNKCRIINQFGDKSFYIEKNQGTIYINEYIAESSKAFEDFSFELVDYRPTINPPINIDATSTTIDVAGATKDKIITIIALIQKTLQNIVF